MFEKEATKLQSESICLEVRMSKSIVSETAQKNGQETRVATLEPPSGGGNMLRVGAIGYGYWGPHIVRNLDAQKNWKSMVDDTFVFTGAVRKIKELTESGALGDLYYYDSLRVNLGLFQHDVSVIWDLAPHDLSIMDYLIQAEPEAIVATGEKHLNGVEDVAYLTVYLPKNIIAHINVNWLSPVKIRTTLIGGLHKTGERTE